MLTLTYKIITPERITMEGEATSISAMTEQGEITILPHHVPIVALLQAGEMRVKNGEKETLLAVSRGVLEVRGGKEVIILAESAERSDELELAAIELAKKQAEEALKNIRNRDDVGFADAAAHMERELARYRVALKGKGRTAANDFLQK